MTRHALLVLVTASALAGCAAIETAEPVETRPVPQPDTSQPTEPQPPAPEPEPEPEPVSETVTLSGDGDGNTAPFELAGGDYYVTLTTRGPCYYAVDLNPLPDGRRTSLPRMDEAGQADTYLYGVEAGRYYVSVITGPPPRCGWELDLVTPLP